MVFTIIQMIRCIHTVIETRPVISCIDFIKRVDSRYNSSIKTIFVVLDNASIHRSKKTRNAIVRNYPRIVLVFQPTIFPPPESNRG